MDPITLDPLCRLPYAPFGLRAPSGFMHYFDGRVLGSYLVSSGTFLNPMTGLPVARADCERLDAYLAKLDHADLYRGEGSDQCRSCAHHRVRH